MHYTLIKIKMLIIVQLERAGYNQMQSMLSKNVTLEDRVQLKIHDICNIICAPHNIKTAKFDLTTTCSQVKTALVRVRYCKADQTMMYQNINILPQKCTTLYQIQKTNKSTRTFYRFLHIFKFKYLHLRATNA